MNTPGTHFAKPRLLVVSHVLPFPGSSGQQQRVANTLIAARELFHVTFLTAAPAKQHAQLKELLASWCDRAELFPSRYHRNWVSQRSHAVMGRLYALATGLKESNYVLGRLEFTPARMEQILEHESFDLALFEYFHAVRAAKPLQARKIPCVLDMHNVLWQAMSRQLSDSSRAPRAWNRWRLSRYRAAEERAWTEFDACVAINTAEADYLRPKLHPGQPLIKACMGLDLRRWRYRWEPSTPPRVAFYGGLGSKHNAREALRCYQQIMPLIWNEVPEAELWIIGSQPPNEILALKSDPRVRVTGFVDSIQELLATVRVMLCPWSGTYGFRSRLVEAMAVGVPVVASPDAAYGMEFENGKGITLVPGHDTMAAVALRLLRDEPFAQNQSRMARAQVELHYSFEATYGYLAQRLHGLTGAAAAGKIIRAFA